MVMVVTTIITAISIAIVIINSVMVRVTHQSAIIRGGGREIGIAKK